MFQSVPVPVPSEDRAIVKKNKHAQKNSCPILWPIRLDQLV
jgi:hypothetical protein